MKAAQTKQAGSRKKYALLSLNLASFLTAFMGSAVNLAIPAIGKELHANTLTLSWIVTIYLLATVAFLVPFGRLADITGRKKIFIWGVSIFSLSSLLCSLAWTAEILIVFRIVQGLGAGMIFGTSMAILTSVFPPQERGKAIGLNVSTVYVGLSLGPVLGGFMTHQFGWQSIFYFNVLLGVLTLSMVLLKLKGEWVGAQGEKFDLTGAFLYSIGLVAFVYGATSIDTLSAAKYLFAAGLLIIIFFIRYEMRVEYPVLNMRLFKDTTFAFSNLAALINYCATFAITFLLSLYLQVVKGLNPQTAGLILLFQPIVMAILSPIAGRLSDRVEPRTLSSLGMGITTIGLFFFIWLTRQTPAWLLIPNLILVGVGFALFSSPNSNAVMSSVEKQYYGIASSTLSTMRLLGQAISMAIMTLVIAIHVGNAPLSPEHAGMLLKSAKVSFTIFTAVCFAGIFASLARGKVAR